MTVPRARSQRRRRAITLFELLLVLCLLTALTAFVWPALDRPMAEQRLRGAADTVRAALGKARVEAMSSGRPVVFLFVTNSADYSIEYRAGMELSLDSGSDAALEQQAVPYGADLVLPKHITFLAGETAAADEAATTSLAALDPGDPEAGYSTPILFYPDGTTSDACLMLANEHGRRVEVSLRGLTGVVTVGQTYAVEEELP
ncbi:MAG: GspH/FimT family protein [Planctomycetota bacterium]|jgi:type II secretory pathway pseudopilin PulG